MSSANIHAYKSNILTPHFVVENITHLSGSPKVIRIFDYPILPRTVRNNSFPGQRDLLQIPGITVDDIETSLMKGVLHYKIVAKEIRIIESNINLVQFDEKFKKFLNDAGMIEGTDSVSMNQMIEYIDDLDLDGYATTLPYHYKMNINLIGIKNGVNRVFYTPDQFISSVINGHQLNISIFHNGRRLSSESLEFTIGKSLSNNLDYDVISFVSFVPNEKSVLTANYFVRI